MSSPTPSYTGTWYMPMTGINEESERCAIALPQICGCCISADLVALLWRTLGLIWLCRRTLDLPDWAWTTEVSI
jgi:hypothetical protein